MAALVICLHFGVDILLQNRTYMVERKEENMNGWEIPNPFINKDGVSIRTCEEWQEQREYLKKILAEDLYGVMPPAPGNVKAEKISSKSIWDGKALFEVYDLSFGPDHSVHEKTAFITAASNKQASNEGYSAETGRKDEKQGYTAEAENKDEKPDKKPSPIILCGGFVDEKIAQLAVSRGFCIATPLIDAAAPDEADYKKGTLYKAYPEYSWKVITMWGWLLSRVIDWIKTREEVDQDHVIVAGHSRFGKAALACGVFDERVDVCTAAGSGCGGMGSLRIAGGRYGEGIGAVETIGKMTGEMFPHWFMDSLADFGADVMSEHNRENELRFDANFIGSAIAPRALLILEGLDDTWANPYGTMTSWNAVAEVYRFLGIEDKCAIHFREGGHAFNLEDWEIMLDFCEAQLQGTKPAAVWHTRSYGEPRMHRNWSAPGMPEEPPVDNFFSPDPERIQAMKDTLNSRWAFAEAGLETGMDRFLKWMIQQAESKYTNT